MANNTIWIRHKSSGKRLRLAKFYPSTGWCSTGAADAGLFVEYTSIDDGTKMWGAHEWELVYEHNEDGSADD